MWFSKKTIEQRLLTTERDRQQNATTNNSLKELSEQYLEDVSGGGSGWVRFYWKRSF